MNRSDTRERVLAVERILSTNPQTVKQIVAKLEMRYEIEATCEVVRQDLDSISKFVKLRKYKTVYYLEE